MLEYGYACIHDSWRRDNDKVDAKSVNFVPLSNSFIDLLLFLNVTAVENNLRSEIQYHLKFSSKAKLISVFYSLCKIFGLFICEDAYVDNVYFI